MCVGKAENWVKVGAKLTPLEERVLLFLFKLGLFGKITGKESLAFGAAVSCRVMPTWTPPPRPWHVLSSRAFLRGVYSLSFTYK